MIIEEDACQLALEKFSEIEIDFHYDTLLR